MSINSLVVIVIALLCILIAILSIEVQHYFKVISVMIGKLIDMYGNLKSTCNSIETEVNLLNKHDK